MRGEFQLGGLPGDARYGGQGRDGYLLRARGLILPGHDSDLDQRRVEQHPACLVLTGPEANKLVSHEVHPDKVLLLSASPEWYAAARGLTFCRQSLDSVEQLVRHKALSDNCRDLAFLKSDAALDSTYLQGAEGWHLLYCTARYAIALVLDPDFEDPDGAFSLASAAMSSSWYVDCGPNAGQVETAPNRADLLTRWLPEDTTHLDEHRRALVERLRNWME